MIPIRIYIENDVDFMCDDVCVEIKLPAVPRVGERIFLTHELQEELENMARTSLDTASNYAPRWFYGGFYEELKEKDVEERHLEHLSFGDASYVTHVVYNANEGTVQIELGNGMSIE